MSVAVKSCFQQYSLEHTHKTYIQCIDIWVVRSSDKIMDKSTFLQLDTEVYWEDLVEQLPAFSSIRKTGSNQQELVLMDDYDWDIWQAGWLLLRNGKNELELRGKDGNCFAQTPCLDNQKFWWDLPAGALAEKLGQLISIRAFVPKFSFQLLTESFALLNEDDKTVVRAETYIVRGRDDRYFRFVRLVPLRGYTKEYTQMLNTLTEASRPLEHSTIKDLLELTDFAIEIPASKPTFSLESQEPAEAAVARMAAKMIQLARHQEQGIIDDIDTEFVHQYRVNIRKTRSLINLFRKTLSKQRYQLLKSELKAIGGQTNVLRDLDVFILDHDYYRKLLPESLWPGFSQLFKRIRRQRTQAYRKVAGTLESEDYLEKISILLRNLQQPPELTSKQSQCALRSLVSKKILAQYRVIETDGKAIDSFTPDEAVHELRIECKKLRYLLELFAELFPRGQVRQLVKHLKGLQDNLGRFNDFSVQQEFLLHFSRGKTVSAEQLAAINGLAAVLYNKQIHERGQVVENIAAFLAPTVKEQFHHLFKNSAKKVSQR